MPLASAPPVVDLCTCLSDLAAMREDWWSLYRSAVGVTPFQSPAWLIPWYEVWGGDRAHVIVARDAAGQMIGLLPAVRTTTGLGLAGSGVGDYLAPLVSHAATDRVGEAFEHAVDGIACAFHDVVAGVPWPPLNANAAWTVTPGSTCQAIALPDSIPDFRRALSAGLRRNLRRYRERLERSGVVQFGTAEEATEAASVLESLFDLHSARWRARGERGVLAAADVRRFHRLAVPALHREGLLRLHYLRLDGAVAGVIYAITDRRRELSYIGGFDPALDGFSPGSLLLAYAIEAAIDEGCDAWDFLRGSEAYKRAWGAVEHTTLSLSRSGRCRAL